jgi:inner membrane protein
LDTLTHALSGALIARAAAPSRLTGRDPGPRARMAAGFAAAAFPDIDVALRAVDTLAYLNWHQGLTHSLVMLPLWALLLAHLFARCTAGRYGWRVFFIPACLGLAIHIAGDLATAYGTMLFAPLTDARYSLPLAYVIDPYLGAIMVAGAVAAWRLRESRYPAVAALLLAAGYFGYLGLLRGDALEAGHAPLRQSVAGGAAVHALPQPLEPYNWLVIVRRDEAYETAWISLRRRHAPARPAGAGLLREIAAAYQPAPAPLWTHRPQFGRTPEERALAHAAWHAEALAPFRRFARFPALDHVEREGGRVCVWFADLRFALPSLPPSFRYGACRSHGAEAWRLERLRGAFWID